MKKIISLICILTMCFMCIFSYSSSTQSNDVVKASEVVTSSTRPNLDLNSNEINKRLTEKSEIANKDDIKKINSDMEILNKVGILSESEKQIDEITIDEDNINYLVKIGEYENLITINSDSPDRIEITFQQGDISNNVAIYDDGRFYLNGKFIDVKASTDEYVNANSVDYWLTSPPYGTSSSYQYYHHTDSCGNVPFYNYIQSLAVGTFITIVTSMLFLGGVVSVIAGALGTTYTYLVQNDPYSTSMSYRAYVYTRSDGTGYVNSTYGWCYKYNFNFYSGKNYNDYAYSRTFYRQMLPY